MVLTWKWKCYQMISQIFQTLAPAGAARSATFKPNIPNLYSLKLHWHHLCLGASFFGLLEASDTLFFLIQTQFKVSLVEVLDITRLQRREEMWQLLPILLLLIKVIVHKSSVAISMSTMHHMPIQLLLKMITVHAPL